MLKFDEICHVTSNTKHMETIYTSFDSTQDLDADLNNIISINDNHDDDEMDYDLDYDPNEYFYELERLNS